MFDDEFEENIDDLAALEEEINRENADMNVEEEVEDLVMSVEGSLTSMKETEIVTTRPTGRPTTTRFTQLNL